MINAVEIDYLPVGDGTKSGDAIAIRCGNYDNGKWLKQTIITIDGGNKESGSKLVEHLKKVYNTTKVDLAILTHPDGDHASGMQVILEELTVNNILMHRPWKYWSDLKDSIIDGRITKKSFGETLKKAYQYAYDVEQIAIKKGVKFIDPHQGKTLSIDGTEIIKILSPGKDFYLSLIQQSGKTPEMTVQEVLEKSVAFTSKKEEVEEDLTFETEHLSEEHGETSSENDMSLILLFQAADKKVLFSGDTGTMGLYKAIEYCIKKEISLMDLTLFHVPHHGSRRNLSKGNLKYISAKSAYISCAKKAEPSHPSAIVTNALIRRKFNVYLTKGSALRHYTAFLGNRDGWGNATPIKFSPTVLINKE